MKTPILSICIPTYNREEIVYKCVCNCLRIPYDWIEVVVTDNCSTDNTVQKLRTIKDSRFRLCQNEKNIGCTNQTKCLTNGKGEFCLLLSDEDDFVDVNWLTVRKQLEEYDNAAVFQFRYEDETGKTLVDPPDRVYKANEYLTLKRIFENFSFAGGMILRKEILHKCWKEREDIPLLWSLYSIIIVPMNCACYGDYVCIGNLCVKRSERNNKGTLDTRAYCAGTNEPYWSIESRKKQQVEWIDYFYGLNIDDSIRSTLAEDVVCASISSLRIYYNILYGQLDSPLFLKYQNLIERDRQRFRFKWIKESYRIYINVAKKFDDRFGRNLRNRKREVRRLLYMSLSFFIIHIKSFLKKTIYSRSRRIS